MLQKFLLQSTEKVIEALNIGMMEMINQKRNTYIPEYLLLGILEQPDSIVMKILRFLNKNDNAVREEIMDNIFLSISTQHDNGIEKIDPIKVNITKELEDIFQVARNVMIEFKDKFISTGSVFLAFFTDKSPGTRDILLNSGLDLATVKRALKEIRGPRRINDKKSESRETFLELYTMNLTEMARQEKLDPVIGREMEINRIVQILSRRKKNNPVLIGAPGVGKTVIVEGLAQKIAHAEVPETLLNKEILLLDMTEVIAGAKFKGEFEERLKGIKDEIINSQGNIILFIDEIHSIATGSHGSDSLSASNILKPALARGQLQCIGATTIEEYKKHIEKDKALERRFQTILVSEPTHEETIKILRGIKGKYEQHHHIIYKLEALEEAVRLSTRYINDRYLPDKAIDLLDEAGSKKHLDLIYIPPEIRALKREREQLLKVKNDAFYNKNFEDVAKFQQNIIKIDQKLEEARIKWLENVKEQDAFIKEEDIANVVSIWTNIPVSKITQTERDRLLNMEANIHKRLVGQNEAVKSISNAIRRNRAGLKNKDKPIGTFLFLGPTGVGKTELARSLAEFLFDDENKLIRLDMSEYMERHSVSRIIGSPPGYIGYGEGGQLTETVRRNPFSIILLDELEKAHPDVFNLLLQIFDTGRITDGQGITVSFKNTVIIGTSNLGSDILQKDVKNIGFAQMEDEKNYEKAKKMIFDRLKKFFKPEFLNRIDDIIIFHKLTKEHIYKIISLEIDRLKEKLREMDIQLTITKSATKLLADIGYSDTYGARPLQREIAKRIENPLSQMILQNTLNKGSRIHITTDRENNQQTIKFVIK